MLMELTCAGLRAAVVETQTVVLSHARNQRGKVRQVEQRFLRFEAAGDDQKMMVDDVELVEQGNVSARDIGHKKVRVIRKERIECPCVGLRRLSGFILASEARYLADKKTYATFFNHRLRGLDRSQRTTAQRMLSLAQDGRPQGAGLNLHIEPRSAHWLR